MTPPPVMPGSIWRAKHVINAANLIKIVSATNDRRVWLVEVISGPSFRRRQVRMSTDGIRSSYTPLTITDIDTAAV